MIACLDRLFPDNEAETRAEDHVSGLRKALELSGSIDYGSVGVAGKDFGGLYFVKPLAFIRPSGADDLVRVVSVAARSSNLTVAARGNGLAMADQGLVIDMRAMNAPIQVVRRGRSAYADVSGGALWEEVLKICVSKYGLAPRSWTDYLGLTVGGTLSNQKFDEFEGNDVGLFASAEYDEDDKEAVEGSCRAC